MSNFRWSPEQMNRLEHAARVGQRIAVRRRGNEFVVVALRVVSHGSGEALIGRLPMTNQEMVFRLEEIERFDVVDS